MLMASSGHDKSPEFHRQTHLLAEPWGVPATVVPRRYHFDLRLEFAESERMLLWLIGRPESGV